MKNENQNENLVLTPEEISLILKNRKKAAKKNKAVTLDELNEIVQKTVDKEKWPQASSFKTRVDSLIKKAKQYVDHESIFEEAIQHYQIEKGNYWSQQCSYFKLENDELVLSAHVGALSGTYVEHPFGKIAFQRQNGDPILILDEELCGGWFHLTKVYKQSGVSFDITTLVTHNVLNWRVRVSSTTASYIKPLCEFHRVLFPFYYDVPFEKQTENLIPVEKLCEEAAIWLQHYVKRQIKKSKEAFKQALSVADGILDTVSKGGNGNNRIDPKPRIVFKEAVQLIRPSDFYSPYFTLDGVTLDGLYGDLEEIGTKDVGDGILHLFQSKKSPYMYRFYKEQKEDSYDHPAGYHWSSRSSVINAVFGTKIMEVTICETPYSQCTCAMAVDKVAELIPSDYEIVEVEEHGELVYEMKKANNQ